VEQFVNLTDDQKEFAIKKGKTLPSDAVNLRMVFNKWGQSTGSFIRHRYVKFNKRKL